MPRDPPESWGRAEALLGETTVAALLAGRSGPWDSPVDARGDASGRFTLCARYRAGVRAPVR